MKATTLQVIQFLKDNADDILELNITPQGALPITLRKYGIQRECITESDIDLATRHGGIVSVIVQWDVNVDAKRTHFSVDDSPEQFQIITGQHIFEEWMED